MLDSSSSWISCMGSFSVQPAASNPIKLRRKRRRERTHIHYERRGEKVCLVLLWFGAQPKSNHWFFLIYQRLGVCHLEPGGRTDGRTDDLLWNAGVEYIIYVAYQYHKQQFVRSDEPKTVGHKQRRPPILVAKSRDFPTVYHLAEKKEECRFQEKKISKNNLWWCCSGRKDPVIKIH